MRVSNTYCPGKAEPTNWPTNPFILYVNLLYNPVKNTILPQSHLSRPVGIQTHKPSDYNPNLKVNKLFDLQRNQTNCIQFLLRIEGVISIFHHSHFEHWNTGELLKLPQVLHSYYPPLLYNEWDNNPEFIKIQTKSSVSVFWMSECIHYTVFITHSDALGKFLALRGDLKTDIPLRIQSYLLSG